MPHTTASSRVVGGGGGGGVNPTINKDNRPYQNGAIQAPQPLNVFRGNPVALYNSGRCRSQDYDLVLYFSPPEKNIRPRLVRVS